MSRRHGLSLVEVLLAIGIIIVLIGLLLPVLVQHRGRNSYGVTSRNNHKQIVLACHTYASVFGNKLPPLTDIGPDTPTGAGLQSLFFNLLPYIEQDNVYRLFNRAQPGTYYAPTSGAAQSIIRDYISPADWTALGGATTTLTVILPTAPPAPFAQSFTGTYATTSYAANGLVLGGNDANIKDTFTDGLSNTILFAERPQVCTTAAGQTVYNLWAFGAYGPSTPAFALLTPDTPAGLPSTNQIAPVLPLPKEFTPASIPVRIGRTNAAPTTPPSGPPFLIMPKSSSCDPRLPGTPHFGGMLVSLADGSVRPVSPTISQWSFWAACTPNGQEKPHSDWTSGN